MQLTERVQRVISHLDSLRKSRPKSSKKSDSTLFDALQQTFAALIGRTMNLEQANEERLSLEEAKDSMGLALEELRKGKRELPILSRERVLAEMTEILKEINFQIDCSANKCRYLKWKS